MESTTKQASPWRKGIDFDELKLRGLPQKHAVATCNFGIISASAGRKRKTKKPCYEMAGFRMFKYTWDSSQQSGKGGTGISRSFPNKCATALLII
jgi:hypothetical protein